MNRVNTARCVVFYRGLHVTTVKSFAGGPASTINYGWWFHARAGDYRRIRGQGLEPKKKFDHMEFLENTENRREHPRLYKWIEKRKRDQAWGNKWFPFFPDILFYLKFFMIIPVTGYMLLHTYDKRKQVHRSYQKKLVRDYELEATFYKRSNIDKFVDEIWAKIAYAFEAIRYSFTKNASKFDDLRDIKTNTYSDLLKGHYEYLEDKKRTNKFFLTPDRGMVGPDGEGSIPLKLYGKLPLRLLSEFAGFLANLRIPVPLREPLYSTYSKYFGVKMSEAAEEDFRYYPTINSFFRRALKPGIRPIDKEPLVSPADGKILYCSKCENGLVEQVKGVNYSIRKFLGRSEITPLDQESETNFIDKLKTFPDSELYQIVIYLAPGDYHRFHSSAEFMVKSRRYYPGDLFSVNPWLADRLKELFVLNERATLIGQWPHGFFSYCAVGATNVGSIIFHYDPDMVTNKPGKVMYGTYEQKDYTKIDERIPEGLPLEKGEMVGEFNLGSTIVLIFEAPKNFEFLVEPGEIVKVGQKIGRINE